jgi:hypothetical protein
VDTNSRQENAVKQRSRVLSDFAEFESAREREASLARSKRQARAGGYAETVPDLVATSAQIKFRAAKCSFH